MHPPTAAAGAAYVGRGGHARSVKMCCALLCACSGTGTPRPSAPRGAQAAAQHAATAHSASLGRDRRAIAGAALSERAERAGGTVWSARQ